MILEYKDVLLRHQKSVANSRSELSTEILFGGFKFAVPVVASNMKSIITPEICKMFDEENWFYVYHRIDGPEDVLSFLKYAQDMRIKSISVGVKPEWVEFVKEAKRENLKVDFFTVDVALSYNDNVIPICRTIRENYPDAYIILGNGCTEDWARWVEKEQLADCLKVGIGVSKACRTRQYTGFGSSTLGSLKEIVEVSNLDIMSDGGLTVEDGVVCIGDIAKSVAFGADMVMSGAIFSRCIDNPAVLKGYYGNASREAKGDTHVEGELIKVESNGLTMKEMMKLIKESLRSSISYCGGRNVYDLFQTPYDMAL